MTKVVREHIQEAINHKLAICREDTLPDSVTSSFHGRIPTLEKGVWQKASPMLQARFTYCGRWLNATHGTWLSISDMEALWQEKIDDTFLDEVKFNAESSRDNWDNHIWGLFRSCRLSLFAGSDFSYEAIFLLWLDSMEEPEIWAYDCNGESRYKNLDEYLNAYISDDVSACECSWRVE